MAGPRMRFHTLSLRLAGLALLTLTGACATRGDHEAAAAPAPKVDRADQMRRGVADAATTPLRDVGLIRPEIPAPLKGITYPYESNSLLSGCPQVLYEIGQLDAVLGVENYQPGARESLSSRGADAAVGGAVGVAQDAAEIVPFRGWVRRASGAQKAEREAARAIEMGQMRRAYLRGYGSALGCLNAVPAPPPPPRNQPVDPRTPPPAARDVRSPR